MAMRQIVSLLLATTAPFTAAPAGRGEGPATQASESRVVQGQVVDTRRVPVAGAIVLLRPADDPQPFTEAGAGRADASGRCRIDLLKLPWARGRLASGPVAQGFAFAIATVEAGTVTTTLDFRLADTPWRETRLCLADPSGRPAAGVDISCFVGNVPWSRLKTNTRGCCQFAMAPDYPFTLLAKPGSTPPCHHLADEREGPTRPHFRFPCSRRYRASCTTRRAVRQQVCKWADGSQRIRMDRIFCRFSGEQSQQRTARVDSSSRRLSG